MLYESDGCGECREAAPRFLDLVDRLGGLRGASAEFAKGLSKCPNDRHLDRRARGGSPRGGSSAATPEHDDDRNGTERDCGGAEQREPGSGAESDRGEEPEDRSGAARRTGDGPDDGDVLLLGAHAG